MTGGDFTQDAYEALRSAYADQLSAQDEQEIQGVQVMGQKMTMETLPVDSPWRDKIESWEYPTGKSAYTDGPQKTPQEVLELMREAAAERDEAQAAASEDELNLDEMSDDELDALLDEVLNDEEEEGEEESGEESEESEEGDLSEMSDEEFDAYVDQLLDDSEEEDQKETEAEDEAEEEAEPDVEETLDPESIAEEIAALREELEGLKFTPEG